MDLYVHDMPHLNIYPYRKDSLAKYCSLFQKNPKAYQPVKSLGSLTAREFDLFQLFFCFQ